MTAVRDWFTTILFWWYITFSNPLWWLVSLPIAAFSILTDPRRRLLHRYTSLWAYHYVSWLPLWKTTWSGRDHIQDDATYMIVANHQSLGDILVLFGLGKHYKWVSKSSIFKVPFVGWNMVANDYVGLKRGDRESILKMLDHCRTHLKKGSSILMFPEGTRSPDGKLKGFKHGAFSLAKELGVPVVPIVIDGSLEALPKHGFMLRNPWHLPVTLSVLEPMVPREDEDAEALMNRVRDVMAKELARLRGLDVSEVVAEGTA